MTKPSKKRKASKLGLDHPSKSTTLGLSSQPSEAETINSALVSPPEAPEPTLRDALTHHPRHYDLKSALALQRYIVANDNSDAVILRIWAGAVHLDEATANEHAGWGKSWTIPPKSQTPFPRFSAPMGSRVTIAAYSIAANAKGGGPISLPLRVLDPAPRDA